MSCSEVEGETTKVEDGMVVCECMVVLGGTVNSVWV